VSIAGGNDQTFSEIAQMIAASRGKALQAVNTELVDELAAYIAKTQPGLRGFYTA